MHRMLVSSVILLLIPVSANAPHVKHYERLARSYFSAWNAHSSVRLADLLAEDASLRDWNVEKRGRDAVVEANVGIWKAVPRITIELVKVHVANVTRTVTCEILVQLHNEANEVLKVADVITYDEQDKIVSVRAYKG